MIQADKILIKPIVTEKAAEGSSHHNCYAFKVAPCANRIMVREAIARTFGKTVTSVRIVNVKPKPKANRHRRGQPAFKPGYKKAFITLKAGETIDLV